MLRTLYEHYYERIRPIAGTYYPPKNSLLSARCVFEDGMFRKLTKIVEHEPVEKIPYTAGVIY